MGQGSVGCGYKIDSPLEDDFRKTNQFYSRVYKIYRFGDGIWGIT